MGTGAFSGVATNGNKTEANAVGQLVPRSPPGLPRNVLVYAVPSSQVTKQRDIKTTHYPLWTLYMYYMLSLYVVTPHIYC